MRRLSPSFYAPGISTTSPSTGENRARGRGPAPSRWRLGTAYCSWNHLGILETTTACWECELCQNVSLPCVLCLSAAERLISSPFPGFAESAIPDSTPLPDFYADPPKTLVAFCRLVLLTSDPDAKVALTRELVRQFRSGELKNIGSPSDLPPPDEPPRPSSAIVVAPGKAPRIGRAGTVETRVRLMHSLAAVEQYAIDLSLDAICRFWNWRLGSEDGKTGRKLPMSFFSDFLKVAEDEVSCLRLLLSALD